MNKSPKLLIKKFYPESLIGKCKHMPLRGKNKDILCDTIYAVRAKYCNLHRYYCEKCLRKPPMQKLINECKDCTK